MSNGEPDQIYGSRASSLADDLASAGNVAIKGLLESPGATACEQYVMGKNGFVYSVKVSKLNFDSAEEMIAIQELFGRSK